MLGGLSALIAGEVGGIVRRNVTVLALYLLAFLLVAAAVGYGLNALHTVLTFHYGAIAASLWIGGGLLVAALICVIAAAVVKNRRQPVPKLAMAAAAAPAAARLVGSGKIGWKAGIVGGVVMLGLILGRQLAKGDDGDEA
jgi:hypothetical protein